MTPRIMPLDMLKLRRLSERRNIPVQMPHPLVQIGIPTPDIPDIGLEVLDVDRVEPDYCRVEPDVCFGDMGGGE